jgi:hypothetical protein
MRKHSARIRLTVGTVGLLVLATATSGCVHVLTGTLVGAGVGAIAGGRAGTAIGAGAGAISGALVGIYEGLRRDEQREKRYPRGPVHVKPADAEAAEELDPTPAESKPRSRADLSDSPVGRQLRVVDEAEYEAFLRWKERQAAER